MLGKKQQSAETMLAEVLARQEVILARLKAIKAAKSDPAVDGPIESLDALLAASPDLDTEWQRLQGQLQILSAAQRKLAAQMAAEQKEQASAELAKVRPRQDAARREIVAAVVDLEHKLEALHELDLEAMRANGDKVPGMTDLRSGIAHVLSRWASTAGAWVERDAVGWHVKG